MEDRALSGASIDSTDALSVTLVPQASGELGAPSGRRVGSGGVKGSGHSVSSGQGGDDARGEGTHDRAPTRSPPHAPASFRWRSKRRKARGSLEYCLSTSKSLTRRSLLRTHNLRRSHARVFRDLSSATFGPGGKDAVGAGRSSWHEASTTLLDPLPTPPGARAAPGCASSSHLAPHLPSAPCDGSMHPPGSRPVAGSRGLEVGRTAHRSAFSGGMPKAAMHSGRR